MAKKKKIEEGKARVHTELNDLNIQINSFGEIKTSISIDKINEFLNRHVDDKKFKKKE